MIRVSIQFFGGRGARSRMGGGAGKAPSLEKMIEKTPFQGNSSDGMWEAVLSNDAGGATIMDETGSSRDPMGGGRTYTGGKYYEYTVWDKDGKTLAKGSAETLNDAKRSAKEEMKRKIKI